MMESKLVRTITIFAICINIIFAILHLYRFTETVIEKWHMAYYEEKGYPVRVVDEKIKYVVRDINTKKIVSHGFTMYSGSSLRVK